MAQTQEFYSGLWRGSAFEAVPYTDLFPEALLVLPELVDGAIGHGVASHVEVAINMSGDKGTLTVTDNGIGIKNINRLLSWTATESNHIQHRYGHGSKKCLAKWSRDYASAKWSIAWRNKDKKGVAGCLNTVNAPFLGRDTPIDEDEKDEIQLMPSGTRWTTEFDPSILGVKYKKPAELFSGIKEILLTRYSAKHFDKTEFTLRVNKHVENSKKNFWKTFEQSLDAEVDAKNAYLLYDTSVPVTGGIMTYKKYQVVLDGRLNYPLKDHFPNMGQKNMKCARLHVALDGRFIEAIPLYKVYNREANHNDFNGQYGIINFIPNKEGVYESFPTPCTTKVSFYENCPQFKKFMDKMAEIHKTNQKAMPKDLKSSIDKSTDDKPITDKASHEKMSTITQKSIVPRSKITVVTPPLVSTAASVPAPFVVTAPVSLSEAVPVPVPAPVAVAAPVAVDVKKTVKVTTENPIKNSVVTVSATPPPVINIAAHTKLVPQSQLSLVMKLESITEEAKNFDWTKAKKNATPTVDPGIAKLMENLEDAIKIVRSCQLNAC